MEWKAIKMCELTIPLYRKELGSRSKKYVGPASRQPESKTGKLGKVGNARALGFGGGRGGKWDARMERAGSNGSNDPLRSIFKQTGDGPLPAPRVGGGKSFWPV